MRPKVFIHTLSLSAQEEVVNFQVRIPKDVEKIVGIDVSENTFFDTTPEDLDSVSDKYKNTELFDNINVGELRLQSNDKLNVFYAKEIVRNDNSLLYGDFAFVGFYKDPTFEDFWTYDWTAASTREPLTIEVEGRNRILSGFYRDQFNKLRETDSDYKIRIYFYYEPKATMP